MRTIGRGCIGVVGVALVAAIAAAGSEASGQEPDNAIFHYSLADIDAASAPEATVARWDGGGWIGTDFDRLWWSTSGETADSELQEVEAMLLYGRYVRRFWDLVVGYRHDFEPTSQGYFTVGLMGLAPYWFEVGLLGFVSDRGKPSVRLDAENDLYLTQRLVLTLEGEVDWLITDDDELDTAAGVGAFELGFRTRYEVRRKFAPYVGVTWVREKEPRTVVPGELDTEGLRLGVGLRLIY